jgi:hypothetical protein
LLYIAIAAVVTAAGCASDRTTAPGSEDGDWSLVRFHEASGGVYRDLTLQRDGTLWLEDGRTGDASSARGLLAGERLETLVRLIDDLPRRSYTPATGCENDGYFVSLTRAGEVATFASGSCDESAPQALTSLHALLSMVVEEVREPRLQTVRFQVVAAGSRSDIRVPRRVVLENLDDLLGLLQEHDPGQSVVVPRIDFRHQLVIAHFLGEKPSGGYGVSLEFVERTDAGWLSLHYLEESPGSCTVFALPTQPYVIVAVERPEGGILFESETVEAACN